MGCQPIPCKKRRHPILFSFLEEIGASIGISLMRNQAEEVLRKHRNHLEELVEERTIELQKTIEQLQQEITERKRAEEDLRENEEVFRKLSTSAQDAIIMMDNDGNISYCNEAAEKNFGYKKEDLLGRELHTLLGPERYKNASRKGILKFRETGSGPAVGKTLELAAIREDGTEFPIELSVSSVKIKGRWNAIGILRDITERKQAEDAFRRQSALSNAINEILHETLRCDTDSEVAAMCLDVAEVLTGSKFGFIGEMNQAGLFDTIAISNPGWDACKMPGSDSMRLTKNMPLDGIDRSTLREEKSRIVNDPDSHPDRVGTPEGHPPITYFLGVPLKHEGKTIGMIGLANKDGGYDLADQEAIETIAISFVTAMNRKRSEKVLQDSEEKYRLHFENVNDIIYSIDPNFTILNVSPSVERVLGYKPEELIGESFQDLNILASDSLEKALSETMRVLSGERIDPSVYGFIAKDGTIKLGEISSAPLIRDGKVVAIISIARDITERKINEEKLRKSNRAFKMLCECNEELLRATEEPYLLNALCRIVVEIGEYRMAWVGFVEEDEEKALHPVGHVGYEKGYLDKVNITWEDIEQGQGPVGKAIKTGNPSICQNIQASPSFELRRTDAAERGYTSSISLPLLDDEKAFGVLTIYSDKPDDFDEDEVDLLMHLANDLAFGLMTLRAKEEKEKIESQFRAVQRMEAIGNLAGGIAHDFNNILTVIKTYTQLLIDNFSPDDQKRKDLEEVLKASEQAANLTRQLLAFSRKQALRPAIMNVNDVLEDIQKMLGRLLGEDIELQIILDPNLKKITADHGQTEQIIMNLSVNARDAMPKGGKLTIQTENVTIDEDYCKSFPFARSGEFVCLTISDTGAGMDKETIDHIFEPFFTTKRPGEGTGLGLSVVYGIVKQHDGWINVFSEPGRGSSFKIHFMVSPETPDIETQNNTSLVTPHGGGEGILVVEDEEGIRKVLLRILRQKGYNVYTAGSAEEALDIFEADGEKIHLLLSDVVLPGKSGVELAEELLSKKPDLRVLFGSGYADKKSQWSIIQQNGYRFIDKPYSINDLLVAVQDVLASD